MYTMFMSGAHGGQTRVSEPLELELHLVLSYRVGARNRTLVLWASIRCTSLLGSLSYWAIFPATLPYVLSSNVPSPDQVSWTGWLLTPRDLLPCFLSTEMCVPTHQISTWILGSQTRPSCLHMCYSLIHPALQAWKALLEFLVLFVCCRIFGVWHPTM